jgi:hypothetical protein
VERFLMLKRCWVDLFDELITVCNDTNIEEKIVPQIIIPIFGSEASSLLEFISGVQLPTAEK